MPQKVTQVVILAGGMGVRLRPLTNDTPKPMVKVNGRPFIEYLIDFLREGGITDIVMCLGYLPEKVMNYLGDGSKFGVNVTYSVGAVEDYTGTRLRNAKDLLREKFLLLYCDNYLPFDLRALEAFHDKGKTFGTVTVYTNKDGRTKNNLFVDREGYVTTYDRSRANPNVNGVDLGFFILHKEILDSMPQTNFWFEEETMQRLIASRNLTGFQVDHPYYSLSTPDRMAVLEKFLEAKKIMFVERDALFSGGSGRPWERFDFSESALAALRFLKEKGYAVHLVTTWRGVELGTKGDDDTRAVYKKTEETLAPHGITVEGIYDCAHGDGAGCECAMPKPGLLIQVARDHCLDLRKTFFLARTPEARVAGEAVGAKTIAVSGEADLLAEVRKHVS